MGFRFFLSLVAVVLVSVVVLFLGGLTIDMVINDTLSYGRTQTTFFTWRIPDWRGIPFWFLSLCIQLFFNGIWLTRLSRIEGRGRGELDPNRMGGGLNFNVPVQAGVLFGRNLILLAILWICYFIGTR